MPNLFCYCLLTVALWPACSLIAFAADVSSPHPLCDDYEPGQWRAGIQRKAQLRATEALDEAAGLQRDGCYDGALAAYHALVDEAPRGELRVEALLRAARLHRRLEQRREARSLYERLLRESATEVHTAEALAAIASIDAATGQTPAAADGYHELVSKFPQSAQAPEAAYWLARTAADEKDTAQAQHYVRWLMEELTRRQFSSANERKLWAEAVCLRCQLAADDHEWDSIQDLAADALTHMPPGAERVRAEFWWAEAEFRTGQFDSARRRFAELDPRTVGVSEAWVALVPWRRAQLATRRDLWKEVLELLQRIDRDHPEFPFPSEMEYLRGRALAGRGRMAAARAAYEDVLNLAGNADPETVVMARWMIGETYFQQRAYAQARAAYLELIERPAPADWQARAALAVGKCLELEDRWDDAQQIYQQALDQWPDAEPQKKIASRLKWAQSHGNVRH